MIMCNGYTVKNQGTCHEHERGEEATKVRGEAKARESEDKWGKEGGKSRGGKQEEGKQSLLKLAGLTPGALVLSQGAGGCSLPA